jgi:hypothetical protein
MLANVEMYFILVFQRVGKYHRKRMGDHAVKIVKNHARRMSASVVGTHVTVAQRSTFKNARI